MIRALHRLAVLALGVAACAPHVDGGTVGDTSAFTQGAGGHFEDGGGSSDGGAASTTTSASGGAPTTGCGRGGDPGTAGPSPISCDVRHGSICGDGVFDGLSGANQPVWLHCLSPAGFCVDADGTVATLANVEHGDDAVALYDAEGMATQAFSLPSGDPARYHATRSIDFAPSSTGGPSDLLVVREYGDLSGPRGHVKRALERFDRAGHLIWTHALARRGETHPAASPDGSVWVSDASTQADLVRIDPSGSATTVAHVDVGAHELFVDACGGAYLDLQKADGSRHIIKYDAAGGLAWDTEIADPATAYGDWAHSGVTPSGEVTAVIVRQFTNPAAADPTMHIVRLDATGAIVATRDDPRDVDLVTALVDPHGGVIMGAYVEGPSKQEYGIDFTSPAVNSPLAILHLAPDATDATWGTRIDVVTGVYTAPNLKLDAAGNIYLLSPADDGVSWFLARLPATPSCTP